MKTALVALLLLTGAAQAGTTAPRDSSTTVTRQTSVEHDNGFDWGLLGLLGLAGLAGLAGRQKKTTGYDTTRRTP